LDAFYGVETDKNKLIIALLNDGLDFSKSDIENALGRVIVEYERKFSLKSKLFVKLDHNTRSKQTHIALVKQDQLTENALIKNKVTSDYNIGTCLSYRLNDNIRLTHSAEIDITKYFNREENYKYGIKIDINI